MQKKEEEEENLKERNQEEENLKEGLTEDDKFLCFVQLSTTPVAVCNGVGLDEGEARVDAARRALDYLRIMTLP